MSPVAQGGDEWTMSYRLPGRQIALVLHIGKTGGTALKSALRPYLNSGDYEIRLHGHQFGLPDFPRGEKVIFFVRDPGQPFRQRLLQSAEAGAPTVLASVVSW
jgi:hypothetical protein